VIDIDSKILSISQGSGHNRRLINAVVIVCQLVCLFFFHFLLKTFLW